MHTNTKMGFQPQASDKLKAIRNLLAVVFICYTYKVFILCDSMCCTVININVKKIHIIRWDSLLPWICEHIRCILGCKRETRKKQTAQERAGEYMGAGVGGGLYRISCLAWSHFFFHNPSVLQSELFGCPGRWQIGLVKGAAMIPIPQPLTTHTSHKPPVSLTCNLPLNSHPKHLDRNHVRDTGTQLCHLGYLFDDIYSELCGCIYRSLRVCMCQQGWMDGGALIVNHCRLCWLSGSGSNGVSIFPYSTMTNEHVNIHTHLLTHIHLGSQSSTNRPLTVACFTTRGGGQQTKWRPALWRDCLQTRAAHTASIHLSLTHCCESSDNLL